MIEKSVECISSQNRWDCIQLNVNTANIGAIKLYQKCGFKIQQKIPNFYHYCTNKDAWNMKRDLISIRNRECHKNMDLNTCANLIQSNHSIMNPSFGMVSDYHSNTNNEMDIQTHHSFYNYLPSTESSQNSNNNNTTIKPKVSSLRLSLLSLSNSNRSSNPTPSIPSINVSPAPVSTTPSTSAHIPGFTLRNILSELTPPIISRSPSPMIPMPMVPDNDNNNYNSNRITETKCNIYTNVDDVNIPGDDHEFDDEFTLRMVDKIDNILDLLE